VIVTVVATVTGDVVTGNAPLEAPPLTTVSAGTLETAVLLENSCTTAPSVTPVNCNVPVAGLPPVRLLGVTETADKDGPAGVAAFTDRFAVRGTLPIAAVSTTIVAGAAAFVLIGNVADKAPAGTMTDDGTEATDASLLNSSAVVGAGSGKARATVPTDAAPFLTVSGETESEEMIPVALPVPGSARPSPMVASASTNEIRRMLQRSPRRS